MLHISGGRRFDETSFDARTTACVDSIPTGKNSNRHHANHVLILISARWAQPSVVVDSFDALYDRLGLSVQIGIM